MLLVNNSIKKLNVAEEPFYELAKRLSSQNLVDIIFVPFKYILQSEVDKPLFEIKDLQAISRRAFFDPNGEVKGDLEERPFEKSKSDIDIYLFCGGIDNIPRSKNDLPESEWKQAEENVAFFWNEVGNIFTMPPTRVYYHKPELDTYFSTGQHWNFCYIFLNDNTGEGVVLSGECSFD